MHINKIIRIVFILTIAAALASCKTVGLNEQIMSVPILETDVSLTATTFLPPGDGPFPLIVLSHGAPSNKTKRAKYGRWRKLSLIDTLTSKGFAVIVPIRRGFGATGGKYAGSYGRCSDPDFNRGGLGAAQDIVSTVHYARKLPFVDGNKILLVGQSAGGFASIAAASLKPEGVIAVLNFSGGRGGRPKKSPGVPCFPDRMAKTIGDYARNIEVPVLWHYTENDRYFSPDTARQWFDAFISNGGVGKLVIQPPYGSNGHNILTSMSGASIWGPAFDQFLIEYAHYTPSVNK